MLHVINSLGSSGGAEHGLVREITRFPKSIEQRVVRLFDKAALDHQLTESGIEVVQLGLDSSHAAWNLPLAVKRLVSATREFDPDVIQSSLFSSNLVSQWTSRITARPVVSTFTLSGDPRLLRMYQPGAGSWRGSALRRLARVTAQAPLASFRAITRDAMVTNCELLGIDQKRVTIIPRGIPSDLRPSVLKERSELGLPSEGALLVNVGRQTAQKGQVTLLEAFKPIARASGAHLAIIGRQGDATNALVKAVDELGLTSHVSLVGVTNDVFHYLSHASAFVFTSYMEGLGTAVLEALSLGLPVVAFDIPPVREITDGGRVAKLVPAGDVNTLMEEMSLLVQSNARPNVDGVRWVATHFSIDAVSRQMERLLTDAAGRG